MYDLEVITPPAASPVVATDLRTWLRTTDAAEDPVLTDLIDAAVDLFENDTGRPVLATGYRQYLSRWPWGPPFGPDGPGLLSTGPWPLGPVQAGLPLSGWPAGAVVLGRGGVTAVAGVSRYLADGSTEALTGWQADLKTPPARVRLAALPEAVVTADGVPVSPVGYVEFTAGWADPGSTPTLVKTAIKLLAAHWYANREAHSEKTLADLPDGWRRVVARYKTGISGDWGQ